MKKTFFLFIIILFYSVAYSQKVIGYWYGAANVKNGASANNYLVELILKQNQSSVTGILNYYFKNTFRSVQLNGSFNQVTRQLNLYNIPLTYFASTTAMEVDCPMDFTATLRVAKAGSNLNGQFIGKGPYKNTCPDITFDLKLSKDTKNEDSILHELKRYKEVYQVWKPTETDTLVAATIIQRPVVNFVIVDEFKKREIEVADSITVDSDSVMVRFYDNGEIDGDSISVFYNKQLISFNRMLSTRAIEFNFGLDPTKEVNELSMFADNLGKIPPNTALMLVYDGNKRYEVRLSSNFQKNATVLIKKRQPGNTPKQSTTTSTSP